MANNKAEETNARILDAALELFQTKGFDATTMRDIASAAGMATGSAYYYYPSKEAIVLDFYQRTSASMQPVIEQALEGVTGLEKRLRALIQVKLSHFAPHRKVLRALLRGGADPANPLSPFSPETGDIRDADIGAFRGILRDCGIKIPRDLEPHLPGVLWFFQMGVILFWVIDASPEQARTAQLLDLSVKSVVTLIRLSTLPLMRPVRRAAIDLVTIVQQGVQPS